jgi:hypothetical protein
MLDSKPGDALGLCQRAPVVSLCCSGIRMPGMLAKVLKVGPGIAALMGS